MDEKMNRGRYDSAKATESIIRTWEYELSNLDTTFKSEEKDSSPEQRKYDKECDDIAFNEDLHTY